MSALVTADELATLLTPGEVKVLDVQYNLRGTPGPELYAAAHLPGAAGEASAIAAPMPGTVIRVLVAAGDHVEARQTLCVLEAMKMETPLVSPYDATVKAVHVQEGDRVAGGALLVELEE